MRSMPRVYGVSRRVISRGGPFADGIISFVVSGSRA